MEKSERGRRLQDANRGHPSRVKESASSAAARSRSDRDGGRLLLLSHAARAARARGRRAAAGGPGAGTLLFKSADGFDPAAPLSTDVRISIAGIVARVSVEQRFHNAGTGWVEAVYALPLTDDAAVDRLFMRVGERVIEGEIREREEAQRIYGAARDSGRHASLVQQSTPNLFTTAVANIGPDDSIVITIEYLQTARYDDGELTLRFPMTFTPRFGHGTAPEQAVDAVDGAPRSPERTLRARRRRALGRRGELRHGPRRAGAGPTAGRGRRARPRRARRPRRRPLPPRDRRAARADESRLRRRLAARRRQHAGRGRVHADARRHNLRVVDGPAAARRARLPAAAARRRLRRRHVGFDGRTFDRAAKAALRTRSAGSRAPIASTSSSSTRGPRASTWRRSRFRRRPTPRRCVIEHLGASGGTEMEPAIRAALAQPSADGYLRQVIFSLTAASPTRACSRRSSASSARRASSRSASAPRRTRTLMRKAAVPAAAPTRTSAARPRSRPR